MKMKDIKLHERRRIVALTGINYFPSNNIYIHETLFLLHDVQIKISFNSLTLQGLKSKKVFSTDSIE